MRIAMFMPSLGPDALGWKVHLDFADAVRRAGHRFDLLTTPAADADNNRHIEQKSSSAAGDPGRTAKAAGDPGRAAKTVADGKADETSDAITVLDEPRGVRFWAEAGRPVLRTRQIVPAAGALARYLRDHGDNIDLLHLEVAYPHGAAGMLAARRARWRGPIAVTPMGEDILVVRDRSYGMRRYPGPSLLVRWTLRRAAAIRCISPLAEAQIAELAPHTARRVIPLNISVEAAAAAAWSEAERVEYRLDARARVDREFGTADRPLVLSFGRLHPFKGIDYLIDAAGRIGDATVLVVGPSMTVRPFGDIAEALRRKADALGVADKVHIVGGVPPARALEVLAAADVVVVPSPLESLNKVCMEAAAVGTPFVVTETTGISAWVPDENVGLVVPPRNVAALAWAIDEVIAGHFRHDGAAAARFADRFHPDRIAAEVIELYEGIV